MNIFRDYTFAWWQAGMLKLAVLSIGIAIGASWPQLFAQYAIALVVIGVVLGIYLAVIAFKQ